MDYKFRTAGKQAFLSDIAKLGFDINRVTPEAIEAGYYQDKNFTVKWLGSLTVNQAWDEEGNLINPGIQLQGEFVDMRTVQPLPDSYHSAFDYTEPDSRYPHAFS